MIIDMYEDYEIYIYVRRDSVILWIIRIIIMG